MTLLLVSFIAGVLTVLAPCVLPLLPIIIGSSVGARSKATPVIVIASLAGSILLFTYLLKASTALIQIPPYVWSYISGGILVGFGILLIFPTLWESLPFVGKASTRSNQLMGAGHQKNSLWGDVLVGAALGPVFSTCSPTYFVILATVLPASFWLGTTYLLAYLAGLVCILGLIALLGQKITTKLQIAADGRGLFKKVIGGLFVLVGIFIITGLDKTLETKVLDSGYFDITQVEQKILDRVAPPDTKERAGSTAEVSKETSAVDRTPLPPLYLQSLFPKTDWEKVAPALENVLSGGPTKDGIPALTNPKLVSIHTVNYPDDVQVIVLQDGETVRAYPYNILTWHEIVNDTVAGVPVAVTFCPLCGSAIVYNRTLPNGEVSTFGVSGSLLESNMIMYDRKTENLWQQSTGESLAGSFLGEELSLVDFQLLDVGTLKALHPTAQILSTDTGYNRDYTRNPYAGYEFDNRFVFDPSNLDTSLPPKTIMVVFKTPDGKVAAAPWTTLREKSVANAVINTENYTLEVSPEGELTVANKDNVTLPFYFEMWFSTAVQHPDVILLEL